MLPAKRILIIGNCQIQPLKHGLGSICRNASIDALGVHTIAELDRKKIFSTYIANKKNYDLVLSIHLSDEFGPLNYSRSVETFSPTPVVTISNIYFNGLHPDITYVGGLSSRMPGPIGDYHSQIALLGYLVGLSPDRSANLYCHEMYDAFGYYDTYGESLREMKVRDTHTNVAIGDILDERLRSGVCFLSHNHPTSFLLAPYINKIANWLSEKGYVEHSGLELRHEEMINFLAYSTVFPIYPELANFHNMPYAGGYVFRTSTVGDEPSKSLNLIEFVRGEHESFRHADQNVLRNTYPGNLLLSRYSADDRIRNLIDRL